MIAIREYAEADVPNLERGIIELQTFEKTLEPNRAEGETIAAAYRRHLLVQCQQSHGRIFIAEVNGQFAGFICVLSHHSSEELIEQNPDHAYITDLVVLPPFRRQSVGRELLQRAADFARQQGAKTLYVDVLAKNRAARELYATRGFQEHEIRLRQELW